MAMDALITRAATRDIALTDRQIEILSLVLEGKSTKEVATSLFVSKRTVDFHLSKIYRKLNASNRVQAIRMATQLGLVPDTLVQHSGRN